MIVTRIERQKRDPHRFSIYLDGEFTFGVHEEVLVRFGLRKGDSLETDTIKSIQSSEELSLARRKALRLIHYRMRSEKELRTKLLEAEFDPGTVNSAIEQLRSIGIVDDEKFARAFVHDIHLRKPAGRRLVLQQLLLKGVPQKIIRQILDEHATVAGEQDLALEAGRTVFKRIRLSRKTIEPRKQQQRVAQFLARRGFGWETISPVLRTLFKDSAAMDGEE